MRGPGAVVRELPRPALAGLVLLVAVRTEGALLLAQALADGVAGLAGGHPVDAGSLALGAAGVLVQAVAAWAVRVVAARTATAVKSRLRLVAAEHLASGAGVPPARAAAVAGAGLDDLDDLIGTAVPAAIAAAVVPLMVLGRVLVADPLSGLIVALTLPLVPVFLALVGMHTRERTAEAVAELGRLAHHVAELAAGLPVIVGLGRVAEQSAALARLQARVRRRTRETLRTAFLSSLALELVATISVAVVAVVLGVRLGSHDVPLSIALLVLVVAPDAFGALRDAGAAYHASQKGTEALDAVRALRSPDVAPVDADTGLSLWDARVRRDDRLVVGPVDLDVRPGELVAIAGPSGCGKSTLLAALAGIPSDDVALTGIVARAPRLGYAPQEPHALAADVAGELALVAPDEAAAHRVAVELGIDGLLAARTADLSPGERRRLGVVRALLRVDAGAGLLLLDEPTAHLDAEAAELVHAALDARRGRAAILVVTHDPALQAAADRIVRVAPATSPRPEEVRPSGDAPRDLPSTTAAPAHTATAEPARSPVVQLLTAAPGRWILAVALGLLATAAALSLTALSGWLIVQAASGAPILLLLPAIVGVRFFGLGRAVARYAERRWTHDALFTATDRMRLRIWRAIAARAAGSRHLQEGGTAVDHLVTGIETVREAAPRVVVPIAGGMLAMLGAAVTVAALVPAALPAALVLGGAAVLVPVIAALGAARAEARRARSRSSLTREAAALAAAGPELAANGARSAAVGRLAELDARAGAAERTAATGLGVGEAMARAAAGAAALLVVAASAGAPGALVGAAALLALATVDPLGGLAAAAPRIAGLRTALRALSPFLGVPAELPEPTRRPVDELRLEGLTVRWPGAADPVLDELDARAARGDWLVVRGPSGSGKSTLLTALLGGLPAESGRILVDGAPLASARPLFAWCPQDAHVFDSTLRGNLLLAGPATDADLMAALERVGHGPLLRDAPDGLDTRVGSTGRALSGGERRRLAVARALLTGSDVLLLDEPTAHLDEPGADALLDDLRAATRDRLVVLVTHRDADVRAADRVLDLGRGRTIAAGPASVRG
ncbi:thiol reductant ABC exporter subunit CydC [Pseudolysinimonas sp.]|uniref:thiol reductant ABC exporter subunit CydC n=1 Tax=Pseudolysinimonas sp. TaxID=2680009 RepID=UPI003F806BC1